MWGDSFQNTCYVVLEVLNMRHNVLNLLSQRNIDTKLSVKPTVVASGLKSFNQKVYCTTNNFSTAILDNIIPIYNMEGEIQIQCSYKGSYTVSECLYKWKCIKSEVTPLLKLKKIHHAGGTPNQNASSLSKYRPSDGPHSYTYTCPGLWGAVRPQSWTGSCRCAVAACGKPWTAWPSELWNR